MTPAHTEDLVYVHSNLRLLSRHNVEYVNTAIKMWDIAGDSWNEGDIHEGAGILKNATLTLDEPKLEAMVIGNANTSATTSESEVRSEAINLMMKKLVFDCLVDCLIDYLLFSFNFKLVSYILISKNHGIF